MEHVFEMMQPQMLRAMFASRAAQEQGYQMILGMLTQTGVIEIYRCREWESDPKRCIIGDSLTPEEFAGVVMRTILVQFDLPYLLEVNADAPE